LLPVQNILANEKWELDKQKIKLAESWGYEVLVIWESEYKQSPELIIDKCIKYLTN
jgi:G:T-mismatch repair DNA endonuclease (very short patch repair protein)